MQAGQRQVTQFAGGLPALVAAGGARCVGAHAIGAAQAELFSAVQVLVGPLRAHPSVKLHGAGHALLAAYAEIDHAEAASRLLGKLVVTPLRFIAKAQLAV
ncbi:hypothetical protein D3C72_1157860 [compost metagenome]